MVLITSNAKQRCNEISMRALSANSSTAGALGNKWAILVRSRTVGPKRSVKHAYSLAAREELELMIISDYFRPILTLALDKKSLRKRATFHQPC
jgi:hypothetical protein